MSERVFTKSDRESSIELLRIMAMLMIVAHHFTVHGVMHYKTTEQFIRWAEGMPQNKIVSAFLFPGGEVGVAIFFIITGYFCIKKTKGSVIKVLTQTAFYGSVSLVAFALMKLLGCRYDELSMNGLDGIIRTIILPATGGSYWFVSAYVAVVLLIPLVNPRLNNLSKRSFFWLLVIIWLFWYSFAAFFVTPYFSIQKGLFFYSIGAYIRLHYKKRNSSLFLLSISTIGWMLASIIAYGIALTGIIKEQTQIDSLIYRTLVAFETSVPVPICSIAMFCLFERQNMGSINIINREASTTFGIYLIHDLSIWSKLIWYRLFKVDTVLYNSSWFPLLALLAVVLLFCFCSLIDWIRLKWIEPTMTEKTQAMLHIIKENI